MTVKLVKHESLTFPVLCQCGFCKELSLADSVADFDFGYKDGKPTKAETICPNCGETIRPLSLEEEKALIEYMIPVTDE